MVLRVLAAMFVVAGAIVMWVGYSSAAAARKRRATWLPVEATVVDFAEREREPTGKGRTQTLHAPVYRYTHDGQQHTATSNTAFTVGHHQVGDTIPILVDPLKPTESELAGSSGGCATIGFGALFVGVGLWLAWALLTGRVTLAGN